MKELKSISLNGIKNFIKEIWGQSANGGVYYPNDADPKYLGFSSILMSEAKGLSVAHRHIVVAGGVNFTLKVPAQPGATVYEIENRQDNRFYASALLNGRLAISQASARELTVKIESVTFAKNGTTVKPYFGATESDNNIIIRVDKTLNPTETLSNIRGYGTWTQSDNISIGQGNYSNGGKILQVGQGLVQQNGNQSALIGIRCYSKAGNSLVVGSDNINGKAYNLIVGQGHTSENANIGTTLLGMWSQANSNTLLAVGNGTNDSVRKNAFEVTKTGIVLRSPNGTRYEVRVSDNGTLTTNKL